MTKKYNFSIEIPTPEGNETFQTVNCDSFDEAIKVVKKGVYDRRLELEKEVKKEVDKIDDSGEINDGTGTDQQT